MLGKESNTGLKPRPARDLKTAGSVRTIQGKFVVISWIGLIQKLPVRFFKYGRRVVGWAMHGPKSPKFCRFYPAKGFFHFIRTWKKRNPHLLPRAKKTGCVAYLVKNQKWRRANRFSSCKIRSRDYGQGLNENSSVDGANVFSFFGLPNLLFTFKNQAEIT